MVDGLRAMRQTKPEDWDENWERAFGKGKYKKKKKKDTNKFKSSINK
jgi:hypothetical protein